MDVVAMILLIVLWFIVGAVIDLSWSQDKYCEGFELCNPYWAYKYYESASWFGALVISLVYSALCPPIAVGYWFYKLCTWGRR